jgi:hypothetical protein
VLLTTKATKSALTLPALAGSQTSKMRGCND